MAAPFDWDPFSSDDDPVVRSDELRRQCPIAHSEALGWSLFRHRDVMRALTDHATFSNAVSVRRTVPNGMDPPEHTGYRRVIEPCFSADRTRAMQPCCRVLIGELVEQGDDVPSTAIRDLNRSSSSTSCRGALVWCEVPCSNSRR